ncbi:unnamed protein product, partial [Meganyctiphanes norvegica]
MTFEVNGTVATVIWNSESDNNQESSCATIALVEVKVNGISEGKPVYINTVLGNTNTVKVDLDPCDPGEVDAYITYVTLIEEYETDATYHTRADGEFPGIGIEEPPMAEPGDVSCSIKASWHSVCNKVDDYALTLDVGEPLSLSNTSYTIPDLESGNYTVCVSAYYENTLIGEEFCNDAYVEPVPPGPTKIDTLEFKNDSKEELIVTWTGPDTADCGIVDGFNINWRKPGEGSFIGNWSASSEDTQYIIKGLNQCTMYEVKVEAFSSIGQGPAGYMNATTSQVPPGPTKIDTLEFKNDSKDELIVTWTGPDTADCGIVDGFNINWRKPGEDSIIGNWNASSEDTQYTITGLNQCTMYEVKVEAFSSIGQGPAGYMNTNTSQDMPSHQSRNFSFYSPVSGQGIAWNTFSCIGCKPVDIFNIPEKTGEGSIIGNWNASSKDTQYTIIGLNQCTMYEVKVEAFSGIGLGPAGCMNATTSQVPPGPTKIDTLKFKNDSKDELIVTWTGPDTADCAIVDGFDITWRKPEEGSIIGNWNTSSEDTQYTIIGLNQCKMYEVKVEAFSRIGQGPAGYMNTNISQVLPGPTKIDTLGFKNDSKDELIVTWTGPDTSDCAIVDGFNITWRKPGEGSIIGNWNASSEDTQYTITGLNQCTMYEVNVEAFSGIGQGPAGYMNATTSQVPPGTTKIATLGFKNDSNDELIVTWIGPDTAGCALVNGFHVTWRKAVEASIIGNYNASSEDTQYTITQLTQSTLYEIKVEAFSDIGKGPAGYMNTTIIDDGNKNESNNTKLYYVIGGIGGGLISIALIVVLVYIFAFKGKKDHKDGVDGVDGPAAHIPMDELGSQEFRNDPEKDSNQGYLSSIPMNVQQSTNSRNPNVVGRDSSALRSLDALFAPQAYKTQPSYDVDMSSMREKGTASRNWLVQQHEPRRQPVRSETNTLNVPGTNRSRKSIDARIPMRSKGVGSYRDPYMSWS